MFCFFQPDIVADVNTGEEVKLYRSFVVGSFAWNESAERPYKWIWGRIAHCAVTMMKII